MWRELQRIVSRSEPELGLGAVLRVGDDGFLEVHFAKTGETRRYSVRSAPLHRFKLKKGQKASLKDGKVIEVVDASEDEESGLLRYTTQDGDFWEYEVHEQIHDEGVLDFFFSGHFTHHRCYDLRKEARRIKNSAAAMGVGGLAGPKVQLLPHQLFIAHEVSRRLTPRVLLADEVGLGKTIEAGLIFSSMRALGRANRALIVVPGALSNQWMAEMFRRFGHIFSIIDDERCEQERASQGVSAFEANQHAIVTWDFMKSSEFKGEVFESDWDLLIIDEAHHMRWDPEGPEEKWSIAKKLAGRSRGLMLLTATPQQYGLPTQFGLLNLVDPERFSDFYEFVEGQEKHRSIAKVAATLQQSGFSPQLKALLQDFFQDDGVMLSLIDEEDVDEITRALVDRHGTGRVLFRNRRERLKGFPVRNLHSYEIEPNKAVLDRIKKLKEYDEMVLMDLATGRWNPRVPSIPLEKHPKFEWLKGFAAGLSGEKALILCGSKEGAIELAKGMEQGGFTCGVFHEDLSIVERDQEAARFSEPGGAQLLICSEVGGEGRNFQFVRHLVFMDLPRHPDLVEQRVGRLDRIGQKADIQIHAPWVKGTPEEVLFRWYHEGLDSFRSSWNGASALLDEFVDDIFECFEHFGPKGKNDSQRKVRLEGLLSQSRGFAAKIREENKGSIDVLMDLNSFDAGIGCQILEKVEDLDDDPSLEFYLRSFFDHFGVEYDDYDDRGSIVVKPDSLMFVETIEGLKKDEPTLMTFDREMALKREEMTFLTRDHSIVEGCLSLLLDRNEGVASVCKWEDSPFGNGALVEFSVVIEATGPQHLELSRFLPPQLKEYGYSQNGRRIKEKRHKDEPHLLTELPDHEVPADMARLHTALDPIVAKCLEKVDRWMEDRVSSAVAKAEADLGVELSRLRSLSEVNPLVSVDEVKAFEERMTLTIECLQRTQPRLDGMRLIFTS